MIKEHHNNGTTVAKFLSTRSSTTHFKVMIPVRLQEFKVYSKASVHLPQLIVILQQQRSDIDYNWRVYVRNAGTTVLPGSIMLANFHYELLLHATHVLLR